MTASMISAVCSDMGWSTNTWINPKELSFISLSGDNNRYLSNNNYSYNQFYFDTTNDLLYEREVLKSNDEVIAVSNIIRFAEIVAIVMRNIYSEDRAPYAYYSK